MDDKAKKHRYNQYDCYLRPKTVVVDKKRLSICRPTFMEPNLYIKGVGMITVTPTKIWVFPIPIISITPGGYQERKHDNNYRHRQYNFLNEIKFHIKNLLNNTILSIKNAHTCTSVWGIYDG